MHAIDWVILIGLTAWIIYDGLARTKHARELDGYLLAKRSIPWWAAGLSVMATQLSAITMIGTTGQGYADGLRFVQFYFALPLAMIALSVTLVPFFYRSGVYTAYEYLERRFDAKTRTFTSLLFLLSRGMSCGVIISAPAVVMSLVLGWDLTATALVIGVPAVIFTIFGGVQAITWTDVKIMVIIVVALAAIVTTAIVGLPDGVGVGDGLAMAAETGRMQTFDFTFDLSNQYTFWSGTIAAFFLFCSYFGTDQSQVQRYLTAKSVDGARQALLVSAYWKIPLQLIVLLAGVLVFIFYVFTPPPLIFSSVHAERLRGGPAAAEFVGLEAEYTQALAERRAAGTELADARTAGDTARIDAASERFRSSDEAIDEIRVRARALVQTAGGDAGFNDTNYIIPSFILSQLPVGLIGLVLVAIMMAATSSIAAELNSLATTTIIDFYRRLIRREGSDRHYLAASRVATAAWGIFACLVAVWAAELGSLIEVVNRVGSFFYGSILGVFILAVAVPRANGHGAFWGLLAGMASVALVFAFTDVAYLWHNVVGAVAVVAVGAAISVLSGGRAPRSRDAS
jgi:SSS family solute:Na+ symporter